MYILKVYAMHYTLDETQILQKFPLDKMNGTKRNERER